MTDPEQPKEQLGPVMIAATKIIRPPAARVGKLGNNITLPRTIPIATLVAGAVGVAIGVVIGGLFGSFQAVIVGAVVMGFAGVLSVSWSPVKGETLFQYLGVQATNRARQRKLDYGGESVAVYIGVARLHRVALGSVHVVPGAIDVQPDQVDERGVLRSPHNRNELPLRPHVTQRPSFDPVYDQGLPEDMLSQTGSQSPASRRAAVHQPQPQAQAQWQPAAPAGPTQAARPQEAPQAPGVQHGWAPPAAPGGPGAPPVAAPPTGGTAALDAPPLAEPRPRRGGGPGPTLGPRRGRRGEPGRGQD